MIVVMQTGATNAQIETVIGHLSRFGFDVHRSSGVNKTVLGAIGVQPDFDVRQVQVLEGVSEVIRVTEPYKRASRTWQQDDTRFKVAGVEIGGDEVAVMAAIHPTTSDLEGVGRIVEAVADAGASLILVGYASASLPHQQLATSSDAEKAVVSAARSAGMGIARPISDPGRIAASMDQTDIYLVNAADAHQQSLLSELGKTKKPVLLRRGLASTIEEWLISAEQILAEGNPNVVLCESGIRTFEPYTRYTLDLSAIPVIHRKSHLPVFADPSHGTGLRNKAIPMALAATAAGADGLLIEVHADEASAGQEEPQALLVSQFIELMGQVRLIAGAIGRSIRA